MRWIQVTYVPGFKNMSTFVVHNSDQYNVYHADAMSFLFYKIIELRVVCSSVHVAATTRRRHIV